VYEEGRIPLYHFDVYRIGDESEMDEIGSDDYFYGDGVSIIEWADIIKGIIPKRHTRITIDRDREKGNDYRRITIEEMN
ncbi:MAG: tRNA (adenosine(37)-N6)-threonylcarbamoyltransferase complex ATPase subunit type 1 TsaE, partial [Lachnospiraceae bacterium]|nr:tRNA (adenosine(37)-N6)-threonylcarbamoyltransferase complex ATPase subunit type 1 TsaE [Lachnospiraceae bacterium]